MASAARRDFRFSQTRSSFDKDNSECARRNESFFYLHSRFLIEAEEKNGRRNANEQLIRNLYEKHTWITVKRARARIRFKK